MTRPHAIKIGRFSIDDYHGKHRWLRHSGDLHLFFEYRARPKLADAFGAEVQKTYLQRFGMLAKSPIELAEVGDPQYPKNWRAGEHHDHFLWPWHLGGADQVSARRRRRRQWRHHAPADAC